MRTSPLSLLPLCFLALFLQAYTFLSEYVSEDGSLRQEGDSIKSSDQIQHPRWSSAVDLVLCTGGSAFAQQEQGNEDELLSDIEYALNTWKQAGEGAAFEVGNITASNECGPDLGVSATSYGGDTSGPNKIFFSNQLPSDGMVGFSILSLEVVNGDLEITHADIAFNSESNEIDFLGVLTHEMGHLLGVAHSPINNDNSSDSPNTAATMFPAISSTGAEIAELMNDDELAIQNLYPTQDFQENKKGCISGYAFRNSDLGQRGAHITVFDLEEERSLAGTFTSMNGTAGEVTGKWVVRGLPLNRDFAVFIEPAHREDLNPGFTFDQFNTPISSALLNQTHGFKDFFIEAYPDAAVTDIRLTKDASVDPGFSNAEVIRLTSDSPYKEQVAFFLSQQLAPPNSEGLEAEGLADLCAEGYGLVADETKSSSGSGGGGSCSLSYETPSSSARLPAILCIFLIFMLWIRSRHLYPSRPKE